MSDTASMEGRSAIVTGGGSGIGLACAARFADAGASVVLVGRSEERLQSALATRRRSCGD